MSDRKSGYLSLLDRLENYPIFSMSLLFVFVWITLLVLILEDLL
ncbi:hypothetical protein GGR01_002679 [Acetobacter oeni]|nr:hypothetical protein [Acetobacter oeni]